MDLFYPFLYERSNKEESEPAHLYLEIPIPELAIDPKEEETEESSVIIIELM